MNGIRIPYWVAFFVLPSLLAGAAQPDAPASKSADAEAIFKVSGVSSGFFIHLNCGSTKASAALTVALARQGRGLVHGLAREDAALQRVRSAVHTAGMSGRAMAEKWSEKSLPYLPNLARLVVVEDLAGFGISREEILRVIAPGGVLCEKKNGAWVSTVKPRPKTMDDWTHPHHGADGNLVSEDKEIQFPISLRWIDGTPSGRGGFGSCASCRGVVFAGGRCITISVDDPGNPHTGRQDAFLMARDAYSGFPLWTLDCKETWGKVELDWRNTWPLVASDTKIYVRCNGKLVILNAETGELKATCKTTYPPRRLVLLNDCLVAACWEKHEFHNPKDKYESDRIRSVWWPVGQGEVAAFDPETGKPKWSLPLAALTLVASEDTAYVLTHKGNPPTERAVVAVDLKTGKEKWRVPHTTFGVEPDTCLNFAGPGCAVVSRTRVKGPREVFVLSAKDGSVKFRIPNSTARSIVSNELWCTDGRYDLKTGQKIPGIGVGATYAGINVVGGCVPPIVVGSRFITGSRRGSFLEIPADPKGRPGKLSYPGARGACIQGMVPANGLFYTAQNNCACVGAQVGGFLAIGPHGKLPSADDFAKPRPVEKGPAFGATGAPAKPDDWPMYRQNVERSGGVGVAVSEQMKLRWSVSCVKPVKGPFATAWDGRIGLPQPLTAPVVVGTRLYVVGIHTGEIMAMNVADGKRIWTTTLGSRIDSAPTYYKGLLLVGCHDGWAYAVRAEDGVQAYRVRIAPIELRMVAHGLVESVWPATGAVLVNEGLAYATAGRSTKADGGIAMVAFKPETGETVWSRNMGAAYANLVDVFSMKKGELAWLWYRLNPKTGELLKPAQRYYRQYSMIDGGWTIGFAKRSGRGFSLGRACGNMMVWNEQLVVTPGVAFKRAVVDVPKPEIGKIKHPDRLKKEEISWGVDLKPHTQWSRVHAMALSGNTAFFSGSIYTYARTDKLIGHFLWRQLTADGKPLEAVKLEAPPVYDGLAIAKECVFLSLQDGSIKCWGK